MQVFERAPRIVVPVRPEEMAQENEPEENDQPQEPRILNPRDQPENNPVANIEMIQEEVNLNQILAGARQLQAAVVDFQGGGDFPNIGPGGKANRITYIKL